jgi:hypothetical protein
MSYKSQIYDIVKASWPLPANASSASQASINEMATEISEAVANSVQDDLVASLNDWISALDTFMTAVISTPVVPSDGGAAYQIGLSAAATPVQSAITDLASKIASFRG